MPDSKTEIATTKSYEVERVNEAKEILKSGKLPDGYTIEESAEDVQARMFEQQLNAADDDELEAVGKSVSWSSLTGVPVEIHGFDWRASEKKEGGGPPIYAVVTLTRLDTGQSLVVTCGSWGVWASLINMAERGKIPGAIRILEQGDETKGSQNRPLRLVSTKSEKDQRTAEKIKDRL
jgi:hypothetical protein